MKLLCSLILVIFSSHVFAVNVTFRLNMNGLSGFTTPEVNGTFNNWCGSCNALSDPDNDGIWETTLNLPVGNYEYKFSYDSWAGQENLSASTSCTVTNGNFTNRTLSLQTDIVLPIACWGLCSDCLTLEPENWPLTWADEFDGNSLNTNVWSHNIGTGSSGWGNNELQYYTNSENNLQISNGTLKIIARNEPTNGSNFSSARIITNNIFEFQYGRVEARIKVPMGQGIWPAFWMLGANFESVGWPLCGEIDIMEHVNNENVVHGTMHWLNNTHTYRGSTVPFTPDSFHLYGIVWNEQRVVFTLNNHPYFQIPFSSSNNTQQIFQKPFFFLLNIAVGGNWPGSPDASTVFPATMEVDYIRIYQNDVTSVKSNYNAIQPIIYPNPFQNELNVSKNNSLDFHQLKVLDITGRIVHQSVIDHDQFKVDTRNWPNGIYHVVISDNENNQTNYRVIKSNE